MITIRPARADDAEAMPDIEQSAGLAFRAIPDLAWLADGDNVSAERHHELIAKGACWVAADEQDQPIGFLSAGVEGGALHIWELDVRLDRQGSGIGRALIERAIEDAKRRGLSTVTLTTFRDVAWNAPFYRKFGFRILEGAEVDGRLSGLLSGEAEHGMPLDRRCAMRLDLG
ncbi:N-acetyltransferase [Mesorhizobium sp. M1C.F.Ca.ET.193.01.1.1]|uniref:GNAT family N-acetyltransferase n=1 Tax=unclassified Mesorhizobium TaxID=325217 RepID=UPI000FD53B78|nr:MULTISPECIES: GNAT family N-acetyltransferase [unclassified Mesorhizobium]TGS92968.1 N-acetyltransferase [bacterium M00.F.Ca.ET.177.01.1.1]TGQ50488.1 N-acetyltransferase [Mesorhizobium sp. M1C.F.Ca.ET.210.01.1.1]TGQ65668.1 N-acetyltransferase [Mesorhizobium sp. M1C.F.Ca.ET.212.01.1.1]TGQ99358.1 N-acetyltransferase [Mesorhizobium sp. M1C.F.Ca.ET.204.01.1.1]TGR19661.1 N-acetyltransferase [Mesorhizobium sp. M1C.F.Ca.ET.196.01.1.1]